MTGKAAIIGAGPAGLMAADILSAAGLQVDLFERMPTPGRKMLMAGKSGLNLSHAEGKEQFLDRFRPASPALLHAVDEFDAASVVRWADGLGQETFTGSSGRIFPKVMKAAPLLRAWLARLDRQNVRLHVRHTWTGWAGEHLEFETSDGKRHHDADITVLALGGASWPRLGSDGTWAGLLTQKNIPFRPFSPSNMGFDVDWPVEFRASFAGTPVKGIALQSGSSRSWGDFVLTKHGIEGSAVYLISAPLRDALEAGLENPLTMDLLPDRPLPVLVEALTSGRRKNSISNHLRKKTGLTGAKAAILKHSTPREIMDDMQALARAIKALPVPVTRPRPIEEAISVAGGVSLNALNEHFMVTDHPGLFVAGEMADWEAPTGGYLLTACLAMGHKVGHGALAWLENSQ